MTATVFSPDCRRTSRMTLGTPFSRATERCSAVPSSARPMSRMRMGAPFDGGDHDVVERARVGDAPERAQRRLAHARGDVAAGHVGVLADQRVAHRGDRELIGGEPVRLDPHVDRAVEPADQAHLADAVRALELHLDDLVGELGQLAQREVAGHRHREDGRLVVVGLRDDRRLGVARQVPDGERRPSRARPGRRRRCCAGGRTSTMTIDWLGPGDRPQLAGCPGRC